MNGVKVLAVGSTGTLGGGEEVRAKGGGQKLIIETLLEDHDTRSCQPDRYHDNCVGLGVQYHDICVGLGVRHMRKEKVQIQQKSKSNKSLSMDTQKQKKQMRLDLQTHQLQPMRLDLQTHQILSQDQEDVQE